MLYLLFVFLLVVTLYATTVLLCVYGWHKKNNLSHISNSYKLPVTIVIALRNEAENLPFLLRSLQQQTYRNFEVLLINDHSDDHSESLFNQYVDSRFKWINATAVGKKAAIKQGVLLANTDIILTTDADVCLPATWVESMVMAYHHSQAQLLIGPVAMQNATFFQQIDYFSIEGVTYGSANIGCPVLCSGANLAFSKSWYQQCLPYLKMNVPSGDDMFLLEATKHLKGKVVAIKCPKATVHINGCPTLASFIAQRTRWAGKAPHYTNFSICFTAGLVALTQVVCAASLGLMAFSVWFLFVFLVKFVVDALLIVSVAHYHSQLRQLWYYPLVALLYPLYVLLILVLTLFPQQWKKRALS